jgi:hypothetical protein
MAASRGARPDQLGRRTPRAALPRPDVLADERGAGIARGMSTVFAAVAGAVAHQSPERRRDGVRCDP